MKKAFYHFIIVSYLAGTSFAVARKPVIGDRKGNLLIAERTINGTVKDDKGEVLPGVSVILKGTTKGSSTDEKGSFQLIIPDQGSVLVFSFVGYVQQEIVVNNQSVVDVVLLPDTKSLDEFVVVGYGTQKKSDLTGAISSLSEQQIRERPVQNVVQALQGKVSGVDITSNLRPGEVGQIRIRGNRSINASNEPLYVIDGIPLSASEVAAINPNDIASVEVLKDASATAIYGSRGANGVILINYKEGKKGKISINYDVSYTATKIHSTTDWMNSGQLLNWQRQAHINGGTYTGKYGTAPDPDFDIQNFGGGEEYGINSIKTAYAYNPDGTVQMRNATADELATGYAASVPVYNAGNLFDQKWRDLASRTGKTQNHQLSLSSGTETSRIYLSLGYLNQLGTLKDQDFNRYSLNLKGDITPRKWLTVGLGLNGVYSLQNYGTSENSSNSGAKDSYGQALALMPYARAFDDNGGLLNTNREGLSAHNVLLNIENSTNEHKLASVLSNLFAEVRFTDWLKYSVKFGAQYSDKEYGSFYGPNYTNPFSAVGTAPLIGYNQHNKSLGWTLENLLFFNKQFGIHSIGVTALQSLQQNTTNSINIRAQGITFPSSEWYNLAANSIGNPMGYGTAYSRSALASYMGRINYSLLDRFLVTLSGRWDGASVLATGNKWAFFPSAALAWKLEEESFIKQIDWISQLKLRYSWGRTGNSSVSAYSTGGSIIGAAYVFNETQYAGYKSASMPNKDLRWEKTAQQNAGLDFAILRNRISGSFEIYKAETSDLLMSRSIPPVLGYTSILSNIGRTRNSGIEISVSSVNVHNKDFTWKTDFNWSTNREKIQELSGGKIDDLANGWYIGQPISVFRDYKYDRLWQNTPEDARLIELYKKIGNITALPGQVKIKDQDLVIAPDGADNSKSVTLASGEVVNYVNNGFGTINDADKVILGSNRPAWAAGLTNTVSYRNFELSFFLQARINNLYYGALQTYGRRVENDTWSPENTDAKYPQPTTATFTNYNYVRNYVNGSLVALRNVSLTYTLAQSIADRYKLGNFQVYAQVLNPFIWGGEAVKTGLNTEDITGWDTTAGAQSGGQTNNTILNRSLVVGLRITL
ncbi:TonB-linked outer membrane protein, SusC/RagA family [Dyadobacter koreensis]|uniref:TonB-linked outer membrane protein, SusC/RagA family n=1 Tax=Dyadobacter koreensis TaxID=408657 RepID=A0A1H6VRN8_9BACT|nr:TonB-dependent receptor [Dyadobacter koreensis]SEJ02872.1 TonB-linked outer membrane protein, SusC/RagA family [Dyadobacter koreensis]